MHMKLLHVVEKGLKIGDFLLSTFGGGEEQAWSWHKT
jgi:hypothetical protein